MPAGPRPKWVALPRPRRANVVDMTVLHPLRAAEPGAAMAVIEGVVALLALTALVAGVCSALAWVAWQLVVVLVA